MSGLLLAMCLVFGSDSFIADATAEKEFVVSRSEGVVRQLVSDIQFLRRNMPGVVSIVELHPGVWLYKTERQMPLSDVVKTDFVLVRGNSPGVRYQTPQIDATNWMSFRLEAIPLSDDRATVRVRLRVRLVREDGAAIHIFAPVLGEAFISERMKEDMDTMLDRFAANAQKEIESVPAAVRVTNTTP